MDEITDYDKRVIFKLQHPSHQLRYRQLPRVRDALLDLPMPVAKITGIAWHDILVYDLDQPLFFENYCTYFISQ